MQLGIVTDFFIDLRSAIVAGFRGIADPREALLAGCVASCRFAEQRPGAYRALFATPRPAMPAPPGESDAGDRALGELVAAPTRCMEAGHAPRTDPFRLAVEAWTGLHGIASLRRPLPEFDRPPLEEQVRRMLRAVGGVRFAGDEAANEGRSTHPMSPPSFAPGSRW